MENLSEKEKQLDLLTNEIKYNLNEFDFKTNLEEKKIHLDKLKILLEKYNELRLNAKSSYYTTNIKARQSLKKKLTLSVQNFQDFNTLYLEKENLYNILSEKKDNKKKYYKVSFDLGESNLNVLDYSRTRNVLEEAKSTYIENENFIKNIQNEIKKKPIINPNDPAYQSYLNFISNKKKLAKNEKISTIKKILFVILIIIIILCIIVLLFVEEEDKFGLIEI